MKERIKKCVHISFLTSGAKSRLCPRTTELFLLSIFSSNFYYFLTELNRNFSKMRIYGTAKKCTNAIQFKAKVDECSLFSNTFFTLIFQKITKHCIKNSITYEVSNLYLKFLEVKKCWIVLPTFIKQ